MSGLECPFCDHVVEYEDAEGHRSLSQLLGGGVSQAVAEHTEHALREHIGSHTLEEMVAAMVMADRYIAQVEAERDEAVAWRAEVEARISAGVAQRPAPSPMPDLSRPMAASDPRPMPFGEDYVQPERRERQHVDPDKTLIAHIPVGQRPEGVVGRRT